MPDLSGKRNFRELADLDPELARVMEAWPDLPPHIRAAVLALVKTAR